MMYDIYLPAKWEAGNLDVCKPFIPAYLSSLVRTSLKLGIFIHMP